MVSTLRALRPSSANCLHTRRVCFKSLLDRYPSAWSISSFGKSILAGILVDENSGENNTEDFDAECDQDKI